MFLKSWLFLKKENKKVYSVGYNYSSELGSGNNKDSNKIIEIEFFKNKEIINIFSGYEHSLAISKNNEIYSWGSYIDNSIENNENLPIKIFKF